MYTLYISSCITIKIRHTCTRTFRRSPSMSIIFPRLQKHTCQLLKMSIEVLCVKQSSATKKTISGFQIHEMSFSGFFFNYKTKNDKIILIHHLFESWIVNCGQYCSLNILILEPSQGKYPQDMTIVRYSQAMFSV